MCIKCEESQQLLISKGFDKKTAYDFLINCTGFPFFEGETILKQTKEFIESGRTYQEELKKVDEELNF